MDENIEAEIAMPSEFKFVDGNYFESGDANIKFCYDSKNTQMKAFKVKGVTIARLSNEERINIPNAIDYIGYLTHVRRNIVVGKLYLFHVE